MMRRRTVVELGAERRRNARTDATEARAVAAERHLSRDPRADTAVAHLPEQRQHDGVVLLHDAREDVRPEGGLVRVDADPPQASALHRPERSQAAAIRHLEDYARAACDLTARDCLAPRRVREVVRVAREDAHLRRSRPGAGPKADDEVFDWRDLLTADDTDDIPTLSALFHPRREPAGEIGRLVHANDDRLDVPGPTLEVRERDVDDRESLLRELRRDARERLAPERVHDDELMTLPCEQRKRGDRVLAKVGRDDPAADSRAAYGSRERLADEVPGVAEARYEHYPGLALSRG